MYVKALGILLLLAGLIAGIWKLYDAGGDAREDRIKREWAEERVRLLEDLAQARSKAETKIIEDRVVYRDRIKTIEKSVNNSAIPDDIYRVLCDSGVFTGCKV